ncbi:porin family protein [Lewinella sp. 4G2]|uniref:porin family protein n=1 Tax=Lewinella sp. 4G2 TaxID=1803372 RepID=UPI0007B467A4|nr:porin family protein [Lewinella sp. 4G2]OAV43121.1 hypothetical protein A3850_000805 [Lewinella sp. 4G2]
MRYLLALLICCSAALSAQSDTTRAINRLEVGAHFGIMEHTVDFTPNANEENFRGNTYGLTLRYFDHHLVGIQAELSYVEAGWREDFEEDFTSLYERATNYAEVLILTQFSVGRGAFQPMLQAGPYLAFPLGDTEMTPEGFVLPDTDIISRYEYDIPFRLNYGAQAGLGFNLQLGRLTIQAEGRYLLGFNDIIRNGDTTTVISRRVGYGGRGAVLFAL